MLVIRSEPIVTLGRGISTAALRARGNRWTTCTGSVLECLEQRTLLAADLVGSVQTTGLPQTLVPGDSQAISVLITNTGASRAHGLVGVKVYLSTDGVLDNSDTLVGSLSPFAVNFGPTQAVAASVTFVVPASFSAGDYRLLALIEPGPAIHDDPSNNISASDHPVSIRNEFGSFDGRQSVPLVLTDPDGSTITLQLAGPGRGEVIINNGLLNVSITGSTLGSTLGIAVTGGDGIARLGGISVAGSLASLNAPSCVLVGDFGVTNKIRAVTLGGVTGSGAGTTISIAGRSASVTFQLANVSNLSIHSATPILSLDVNKWSDTDAIPDEIIAPRIASLNSRGKFSANLRLSGDGTSPTLGNTLIAGALSGGVWSITGDGGPITARSAALQFSASFSGALASFQTTTRFRGVLAAASIGTINVGGDLNGARILAGANLGTDGKLGGSGSDADTFVLGTIGSIFVSGRAINSIVGAGLRPIDGTLGHDNDAVVGRASSQIGDLVILATSSNSLFASGAFLGRAEVGGNTVDPTMDVQFFVGGASGVQEATRARISAVVGGTVSLLGGSSVTLPPGAFTQDQIVLLTRYAHGVGFSPNGALKGVGPSLALKLTGIGPTVPAPSPAAAFGPGTPSDNLSFVVNLGATTIAGVQGSIGMAKLTDSSGTTQYISPTVDQIGSNGFVRVSVSLTEMRAYADGPLAVTGLGLANFAPGQSHQAPQNAYWDGHDFRVFPSSTVLPPGIVAGKKTIVFVHGMMSSVTNSFGMCANDYIQRLDPAGASTGNLPQALGFNYDWTQGTADSATQLTAFLRHLKMLGIEDVILVGHSEGTLVAAQSAATPNGPAAMNTPNISQMILLAGPLQGTPVASALSSLARMFMILPFAPLPVSITIADLLHRGFAQSLRDGVPANTASDLQNNRPGTIVYTLAGRGGSPRNLAFTSIGGLNDGLVGDASAGWRSFNSPNHLDGGAVDALHQAIECNPLTNDKLTTFANTVATAGAAVVALSPGPSNFFDIPLDGTAQGRAITITNAGSAGSTLLWQASSNSPWLTIRASGTLAAGLQVQPLVTINAAGLDDGSHTGVISVWNRFDPSHVRTLSVTLLVSPITMSGSLNGTVVDQGIGGCPAMGGLSGSGTLGVHRTNGVLQLSGSIFVTQTGNVCDDYGGNWSFYTAVSGSGTVAFSFGPSNAMGTRTPTSFAGSWSFSVNQGPDVGMGTFRFHA